MRCCQLQAIISCMSKIIYRLQKLKSAGSVRRSLQHAFREKETPNADASREEMNQHVGAKSAKQAMAKFRERWPDKIRKNGVVAVEHLITASPEWFEGKTIAEQNQFFSDALNWLRDKWGSENVVYAGIHRDETSPHMYAYVTPVDERGKLNCRKWLGEFGALSELQTDIAENVGNKYGLERGKKKSRARHTTLKEFYSGLNEAKDYLDKAQPIKLSVKDRFDIFRGQIPPVLERFERMRKAARFVFEQAKAKSKTAEDKVNRAQYALDMQRKAERENVNLRAGKERLKNHFNDRLSNQNVELQQQLHDAIQERDDAVKAIEELNEKINHIAPKAAKLDELIEKAREKNHQAFKPGM